MIKLTKICKDYTIKNGIVHAITDVTLEFPERGMVFVLGRSGCGKSTLLNILGGLDTYTSGEMIVNDVSTKDYNERAWDDYRNREVGFIFQEYNLIDEYDIKNNLAVVGQLQGQDKKTIGNNIGNSLVAVGLGEYEKRKTSELSGGQKQRIAIARAISKETSIILADEPTGNLDSENSKEIMNLLKRISKEKLVVVVTHDTDDAMLFGDRIIKLKDGKIESDLVRARKVDIKSEHTEQEKNVIVNNNVNESLSADRLINNSEGLLENNQIVNNSESESLSAKTLINNGESLSAKTLINNDESLLENNLKQNNKNIVEEYRLLNKKKTPNINIKKSKMGISLTSLTKLSFMNLWKKKGRLLVSVLLFFFTLTLFGVGVSALRYNKDNVAYNAYSSFDPNEIKFSIPYERADGRVNLDEKCVEDISRQFPNHKFNKMFKFRSYIGTNENHYRLETCVEISDDVLNQYGYELINGSLPKANNEFCISKYVADYLLKNHIYSGCSKYSDLINKTIDIAWGQDIKLVGIIDTFGQENYEKIKSSKKENINTSDKDKIQAIERALENDLKYSFTASIMINKSFLYSSTYNLNEERPDLEYISYSNNFDDAEKKVVKEIKTVSIFPERSLSRINFKDTEFPIEGHSKIEEGEIVLSSKNARTIADFLYSSDDPKYSGLSLDELIRKGVYIENAKIKFGDDISQDNLRLKIIGYTIGDMSDELSNYISNSQFDKLQRPKIINALNTKFINKKSEDSKLIATVRGKEFKIESSLETDILLSNGYVDMLNVLGSIFTPAFGAFSVIMMLNLIFTSIKTNKKQIGVLRALGMRSSGIIFIFLTEAVVVGLMAFIMAVITIFPIAFAASKIGESVIIFIQTIIVSFAEIAAMFGLSMAICISGSIIPIIKKAKVPPIKLIKE